MENLDKNLYDKYIQYDVFKEDKQKCLKDLAEN